MCHIWCTIIYIYSISYYNIIHHPWWHTGHSYINSVLSIIFPFHLRTILIHIFQDIICILITPGYFQFITEFILYIQITLHSWLLPTTCGDTQSYSHGRCKFTILLIHRLPNHIIRYKSISLMILRTPNHITYITLGDIHII